MKASHFFTCLGLSVAMLLTGVESRAAGPDKGQQKKAGSDDPKFKYHEASSLSGINLIANKNTGLFTLKFDQKLTETGILEVKNAANKVLFTRVLSPDTLTTTRTFELGKLNPGTYSIEVKTADTTFWTKLKVKK